MVFSGGGPALLRGPEKPEGSRGRGERRGENLGVFPNCSERSRGAVKERKGRGPFFQVQITLGWGLGEEGETEAGSNRADCPWQWTWVSVTGVIIPI